MNLFNLIPSWCYALAVAVLVGLVGLQEVRLSSETEAHANTRMQFAEAVALAEKTSRLQSEENRAIEQELRNAQDQNAQQAEALLAAVDYAVTVDRVASERLRNAAQDLAAVARSRCAASTTPSSGPAGGDPIGVLADVLGRADQRAGELAAIADSARIRGLTCEAEYERAREALNG